ncbi:unnamed protein product [Fraxinus pennsylvanica]|uniref:NADH dehydrogenase [ubiquinone] 1 beta subcomplex subunit 7 n=1 Tax=Fraxinus pennsylvanica TaxID=56036 RepID=A0AAD1ZJL7_9LAMI|nr:unnamed protein product [Fraxinus pennsylvanica]
MEVPGSSKKMIATQEEMVEAKVPIPYRDQCAHLLIPLNKCRQAEFYLPWKCEAERHTYEKKASCPFRSSLKQPMLDYERKKLNCGEWQSWRTYLKLFWCYVNMILTAMCFIW